MSNPILTFPTQITLISKGIGTRNEFGEYVPGSTVEKSILVAIMPITNERDVLEAGVRHKDTIKFFSNEEIKAVKVGANQSEGDTIVWQNIRYKVSDARYWQGFYGIPDYWRCLAVREERQSD